MSVAAPLGLQLMAVSIDDQLQSILGNALTKALDGIEEGLGETLKPEVDAIIQILYYAMSFITEDCRMATPGMLAMRLGVVNKYNNNNTLSSTSSSTSSTSSTSTPSSFSSTFSWRKDPRRSQIILYILLVYLVKRGQALAVLDGWRFQPIGSPLHSLWRLMRTFSLVGRCAGWINTVWFLMRGGSKIMFSRSGGESVEGRNNNNNDNPLIGNPGYATLLYRYSDIQMIFDQASGGGGIANYRGGEGAVQGGPTVTQLLLKRRALLWSLLAALAASFNSAVEFNRMSSSVGHSLMRANSILYRSIRQGVARSRFLVPFTAMYEKIRLYFRQRRLLTWGQASSTSTSNEEMSDGNGISQPSLITRQEDTVSLCAICGMPPENPKTSQCGHTFCYYCIIVYAGPRSRREGVNRRQQENARKNEMIPRSKCPKCNEYVDLASQ